MAQVINPTPFSHALFRKLGPADQEYEVLAVRGTYRFTEHGWPLMLANTQQPIRYQEVRVGAPDNRVTQLITHDHDLVPCKTGTELLVRGTLHSPQGTPSRAWRVTFQVGPITKRLQVYGPRYFQKRIMGGWQLTSPAPTQAVPLDYRYAFGGHFTAPTKEGLTPEDATLYYPQNPVGCGWLPARSDYKRAPLEVARYWKAELAGLTQHPAHQLEAPDERVSSPYDTIAPAGAGPIPAQWPPRADYQGTYDNAWETQRYPYRPLDFDARFYHSAPGDLIAPGHLQGDERLNLINCLPGSHEEKVNDSSFWRYLTRLPGQALHALADHADGQRSRRQLDLDTIGIDLDRGEVELTWRTHFTPAERLKRARIWRTSLNSPLAQGGAHVG